MSQVTLRECEVELLTEPEDQKPENCVTPSLLPRIEQAIAAGDDWAWVSVIVEVRWHGFVGRETLGGCSYRDEAEFRACPYYADMARQALANLNTELSTAKPGAEKGQQS